MIWTRRRIKETSYTNTSLLAFVGIQTHHSHCASLSSFLLRLILQPTLKPSYFYSFLCFAFCKRRRFRGSAMSYDYLFKYIIIGDTG